MIGDPVSYSALARLHARGAASSLAAAFERGQWKCAMFLRIGCVLAMAVLASACAPAPAAGGSGAGVPVGDASATDTGAQAAVDNGQAGAAETTTQDTAPAEVTAAPDVPPVDAAPLKGPVKATTSGAYKVTLQGPLSIKAGTNTGYDVGVTTAAGAHVSGLVLEVSFIHTQMGHGGLTEPFSGEVGGGVYQVTDVQASMAGKWALKLTLGPKDSVSFDVTAK